MLIEVLGDGIATQILRSGRRGDDVQEPNSFLGNTPALHGGTVF
jgi:hypothetical protein